MLGCWERHEAPERLVASKRAESEGLSRNSDDRIRCYRKLQLTVWDHAPWPQPGPCLPLTGRGTVGQLTWTLVLWFSAR